MTMLPLGWTDLDPVFVRAVEDHVVVDCVVTDVRPNRPDVVNALVRGEPVAFRLRSGRPDFGSELTSWIEDGASVSVLRDDDSYLMVLTRLGRMLALDLDLR